MKKFTAYQQHDQMDCGPTCLRMVARHYGRHLSAHALRERAELSREGVSLLGLAEAAEVLGFRTMGVQVPFGKLLGEAPLPCIVHWQHNHFVVVYDIRPARRWMRQVVGGFRPTAVGGPEEPLGSQPVADPGSLPPATVYVADPGRGLLTYSAEEFCAGWLSARAGGQATGIALLLEPTPALLEHDDDEADAAGRYSFGRVLGYLLQHRGLLVQLLLGLAVGSGLQLLLPLLTQSVVDVGVNTQNVPFIYLVLGAQLMLMAGRLSVEFIQSRLLLYVSTRINLSILSDFLIKLLRLPLAFFDTKNFGDLMQRIGDHYRIEAFVTGQALQLPFVLTNLVLLSVVVAFYSLPIFGLYVAANLLYAGWILLFLRPRRRLDAQRFGLAARSQSALVQLIQGMQEIKLAGAERPSHWSWERLQVGLFRQQLRSLGLGQV